MTNHDLTTASGRILGLAEQFEIDPPELKYDEDGELLVQDEWIDWCRDSGASIDWIVSGDPKTMISVYRQRCKSDREALDAMRGFDADEMGLVTLTLRLIKDSGVGFDSAMEAMKRELEIIRQRKADVAA